MSVESLTYADLAGRIGATEQAARMLSWRLRLPRQIGNDGKVRINVDLNELKSKPLPDGSLNGGAIDVATFKSRIEQLQADVLRLEIEKSRIESAAAAHRADFERERLRCDALVVENVKLAALAISAREKTARLEGELAARPSRVDLAAAPEDAAISA